MAFSHPDYSVGPDHRRRPKVVEGQTLHCFQLIAGRKKTAPHMLSAYGLVLVLRNKDSGVFERVGMFREVVEIGKEFFVFEGVDTEQDVKIV
jgi:hypothetical protein